MPVAGAIITAALGRLAGQKTVAASFAFLSVVMCMSVVEAGGVGVGILCFLVICKVSGNGIGIGIESSVHGSSLLEFFCSLFNIAQVAVAAYAKP